MFLLHPLIRDWLQLREPARRRRAFSRECTALVVNSIREVQVEGGLSSVKQNLILHMDACICNDYEFFRPERRLEKELRSCEHAGRVRAILSRARSIRVKPRVRNGGEEDKDG